MDWTQIITTLITILGGIATAYLGVATKKRNKKDEEMLSTVAKLGEKIDAQEKTTRQTKDQLISQESVLAIQQDTISKMDGILTKISDKVNSQESAQLAQQTAISGIDHKLAEISNKVNSQESALLIQQKSIERANGKLAEISDKVGAQESAQLIQQATMSKMDSKLSVISEQVKNQESANLIQEEKLLSIEKNLDDNNLRTLRLDLLHAIETDPNNQLVILEMAQKYFVEMKGNCYMSRVFQEWTDDHHVDITSIFNRG